MHIEWDKWKRQYCGSTDGESRFRAKSWRTDINLEKNGQISDHFQEAGHHPHFRMWGIELIKGDINVLRFIERCYINKYDLIRKGLNTNMT